ncbi:MAG: SRPBCC family protein [Marinilabiliaceae bacterium]|nr:SRPBCC family protein [Marinilabiliaceae bacterium]
MKILLYICLSLATIIAILLILALFVKKDYAIVREIVINRPKKEVFDYIKFLKNQNEWSTWTNIDPKMKSTYSGIDGTVGFVYKYESDNKRVGKGSQEITKIIDGESIEWLFCCDGKPPTVCYWLTETISENETKMIWKFTGKMNYPLNLMTIFFDKLMGNDIGSELAVLKTKMENQTE